jgi:hypothetical protein
MVVIHGQKGLTSALEGEPVTTATANPMNPAIRAADGGGDFSSLMTFAADFMRSVNQTLASLKEVLAQYRDLKGGGMSPTIPAGNQAALIQSPPERPSLTTGQNGKNEKDRKIMEFLEQLKAGLINHIINCATANPDMKLSEILDTFPDPKKPFTAGTLKDMINAARMMGVKI